MTMEESAAATLELVRGLSEHRWRRSPLWKFARARLAKVNCQSRRELRLEELRTEFEPADE